MSTGSRTVRRASTIGLPVITISVSAIRKASATDVRSISARVSGNDLEIVSIITITSVNARVWTITYRARRNIAAGYGIVVVAIAAIPNRTSA